MNSRRLLPKLWLLLVFSFYSHLSFGQAAPETLNPSTYLTAVQRLSLYPENLLKGKTEQQIESELPEILRLEFEKRIANYLKQINASEETLHLMKRLWTQLNKPYYWRDVSKKVTSITNNYYSKSKIHGIADVSAIAITNLVQGTLSGVFLLTGQIKALAIMQLPIPYTLVAVSVVRAPKDVLNNYRLSRLLNDPSKYKEFTNKLWNAEKDWLYLQGDSLLIPMSILSKDHFVEGQLKSTLAIWRRGRKFKALRKDLKKLGYSTRFVDVLDADKSLDPSLKTAFLIQHLKENHPEALELLSINYPKEIAIKVQEGETFVVDSQNSNIRPLNPVNSKLAADWLEKMQHIQDDIDVALWFQAAPEELSTQSKLDLWLNVALPYLSKRKIRNLGFFAFRRLVKNSEEHSIRQLELDGAQSSQRVHWLTAFNWIFPERLRSSRLLKVVQACRERWHSPALEP